MKWREREKIDYKLNKDGREKGEKEAWSIWIGDCQPEMVNKHHVRLVNNIFFYRLFKVGGGFKIWTFSLETPNNVIELQDEGI